MARNVLILYYSQFGNTAKLATSIHRETGADILRLRVPDDYFPDDMEETDKIFKRDNKLGQLPPIVTKLPNIQYYDTILIGGPVWDGKVASPVISLLKMIVNYQGKVAPFSIGWSDTGNYQADFIAHAGKLNVVSGYHVLTHATPKFSSASLASWLRKL
ncbi:MAG: flavodoxin [Limosilactobacillus sp.]|jgi:flavodoxin|uniref:flavodoxin family protein n=1 Tax=Limosilactobacillus sp. TaxID=2773925 RepID=UPI0025BDA800|nr:flavodoxin [Limosilactobacillus sp.]MCI1975362.1 flavodoxin [Limosilactobacillus sp.]MCI2031483.1 flavodoxin [Limosilactobacillus sp.]